MFRRLQVTIIILLVPLLGLYWYAERNDVPLKEFLFPGTPVLRIGDISMQVAIADSPQERERGLSGRNSLQLHGMLFVFDSSDYYDVWMKNMRFPIDVIWISEDLRVVGITEGLRPESYPRIFEPPQPVRYFVETNIHFAESFGIDIGDTVVLPAKVRE